MVTRLLKRGGALRSLDDYVRAGYAQAIAPTTDSGFTAYGPGRLMLPAATNLVPYPSFESSSAGLATGWTEWKDVTGVVTYSTVAGRLSGNAQRIQYTGNAGDGAKFLAFRNEPHTAVGLVAAGDVITISFYLKTAFTGTFTGWSCSPYIYSSVDEWVATLGSVSLGKTDASWTRYSLTTSALPANSSRIMLAFRVDGVGDGGVIDITVDDILIEKSAVLTPYGDGSYSGWSWSGTPHASTSVRAKSTLTLPVSIPADSGTFVMRTAQLCASSSAPTQVYIQANTAGGSNGGQLAYIGGVGWRCWKGNKWSAVDPSAAAGATGTVIGRFCSDGTVDIRVNGVNGAQATGAGETGAASTVLYFDNVGIAPGPIAYIGPAAICPSRITDSETAYLDAMVTAGATGLELFRWFRDKDYRGTMVMPLESDSRAYVVAS